MTTYSAIVGGQIDADSYIDTSLATQWTNNLLAIQEGDASAPKILAAAITKAFTGGSYAIAILGTQVLPVGIYQFNSLPSLRYELYVSAAWRSAGVGDVGGMIWSDGTNMRLKNDSASTAITAYYQKMD